jgi:hypothetical protein
MARHGKGAEAQSGLGKPRPLLFRKPKADAPAGTISELPHDLPVLGHVGDVGRLLRRGTMGMISRPCATGSQIFSAAWIEVSRARFSKQEEHVQRCFRQKATNIS